MKDTELEDAVVQEAVRISEGRRRSRARHRAGMNSGDGPAGGRRRWSAPAPRGITAPMRAVRHSQAFIPTLKEAPADAQVASHKLLVRAGLHPAARRGHLRLPAPRPPHARQGRGHRPRGDGGVGAQEFYLPALHPAEIWKESGRWEVMARTCFASRTARAATTAWA